MKTVYVDFIFQKNQKQSCKYRNITLLIPLYSLQHILLLYKKSRIKIKGSLKKLFPGVFQAD